VLIGQKVVLRDKSINDAANDYAWRCDSDLCLLDAVPTLDMPYVEYVGYYADELRYPSKRRCKFAIDTLDEGRHVGNIMYYDIERDSRQAELGIMVGDREYWGRGYGADAVATLVRPSSGTSGRSSASGNAVSSPAGGLPGRDTIFW